MAGLIYLHVILQCKLSLTSTEFGQHTRSRMLKFCKNTIPNIWPHNHMSSIMITVYDSLIHVLYLWYSDSCPILVIQLRWSLPKMGIPLKSTVFYLQICYNHQNWCLINFLKNSSEKYTKPSIINCWGCN